LGYIYYNIIHGINLPVIKEPLQTCSDRLLAFSGKGDVVITTNDDDLVKLMLGQLNPQQVSVRIIRHCIITINISVGVMDGCISLHNPMLNKYW